MWRQVVTDIDNVQFSYMQVENGYKTVCKRQTLIVLFYYYAGKLLKSVTQSYSRGFLTH